jgi:hypothetical protein
MAMRNLSSNAGCTKGNYRIQFARIMQVLFVLAFLTSAAWVKAALAESQWLAPQAQGSLIEIPVVSATASSTGGGAPMNAFNGIYTDYWHTASTTLPSWLQADFGSPQTVVRVEIYNEKSVPHDVLLATAFDIWVGDDPAFSDGSYAELPTSPATR